MVQPVVVYIIDGVVLTFNRRTSTLLSLSHPYLISSNGDPDTLFMCSWLAALEVVSPIVFVFTARQCSWTCHKIVLGG